MRWQTTPTPIPAFPLKGKELGSLSFKEIGSLPFKGRVRVGMGWFYAGYNHPIPKPLATLFPFRGGDRSKGLNLRPPRFCIQLR